MRHRPRRIGHAGDPSPCPPCRRYLYTPVLQRDAWLREQSMGLLDRLFDGRLAPLVAHFSSHRKLKKADIEALRALRKAHDRG